MIFELLFSYLAPLGLTENRSEFIQKLCGQRETDLIITKSISRFVRNTTIVLETVRELKKIGVEVRFGKENIETMLGNGTLMLTFCSYNIENNHTQEKQRLMSNNVIVCHKEERVVFL